MGHKTTDEAQVSTDTEQQETGPSSYIRPAISHWPSTTFSQPHLPTCPYIYQLNKPYSGVPRLRQQPPKRHSNSSH